MSKRASARPRKPPRIFSGSFITAEITSEEHSDGVDIFVDEDNYTRLSPYEARQLFLWLERYVKWLTAKYEKERRKAGTRAKARRGKK